MSGGSQAVDAVVVSYNARDHLLECVRSLRAAGVSDVVVVDNASQDGSAAAIAASDADVRVLETGANLGYGRAANRGVAVTKADLVLVCNPDLTAEPGAIKALVAAVEADPGLGIVGARIENLDGTVYPSPRAFPNMVDAFGHAFLGIVRPANRFTRRYRLLDIDRDTAASDVDWVSGSCFLARRAAWDAIGGFDEAYFMFAEDFDLCWRVKRAGWRVGFAPDARVVHVQGVSVDQHPYRMLAAHHRSVLRFSIRSTTGWRRLLLPLVAVGLAVRLVLVSVHRAIQGRRAR